MPSLFSAIFGEDMTNINNQVVANDMLVGAKMASTSYLTASLECATPELRRLFSQFSAQCAQAHESITDIAVQKGWYKPYDTPVEQLTQTFKQSETVISPADQ